MCRDVQGIFLSLSHVAIISACIRCMYPLSAQMCALLTESIFMKMLGDFLSKFELFTQFYVKKRFFELFTHLFPHLLSELFKS